MSTVRLLSSDFNKETGISSATIGTDYGIFTASVKLHEEDLHISSRYAGCEYAEMKATIKYMKKRIEVINNQLKGLENYQKQLIKRNDYNSNSIENKILNIQMNNLKQEKADWQNKKESLTNALVAKMNTRRIIVDSLIANKKGAE